MGSPVSACEPDSEPLVSDDVEDPLVGPRAGSSGLVSSSSAGFSPREEVPRDEVPGAVPPPPSVCSGPTDGALHPTHAT